MALTVRHLNADTTFLLTFSPSFAPANKVAQFPGSFTILIDPWLVGHSSILHPSFQISNHTTAPSVASITDLKEQPDLILVSQDKPDHCHRETLCSLPKDTNINILATPAAAKIIRSWKHFEAERIHDLEVWDEKSPETIVDITLPGFSANCEDGLVTIASLVTKRDVTGLHNAIGITYRAPSSLARNANGDFVDILDTSHTEESRASYACRPSIIRAENGTRDLQKHVDDTGSRADSAIDSASGRKPRQTTLSVLYTPHGLSSELVTPYAAQHLTPLKALPLTALFHSLNTENNAWFMGGQVVAGAPGGVELAKKFGAKHWIGAHDEAKENKGLATLFLKSRKYEAEEVQSMLEKNGNEVEQGSNTKVHMLEAGQEMRIVR
ncbi:hypothetical protein MBLNU230_g3615t1 [Neophaeotheca triangularis]